MMLKKVFLVLTPAVLLVVLLLGIGAGSAAQAASSARALEGPRDIPGVISYWPLDSAEVIGSGDKYHDVIARANDVECSTSQDNCPVQAPGIVGSALLFDGVNDQLNKNGATGLSWQNADSFSVEAWVKLPADNNCSSVDGNDVVVSNQVFIGRWRDNTPGNMTSWWLGCGWEKVEGMPEADEAYAVFHIRDSVSASGKEVFSDTVINDDQWHHVVGIYDGTAKEMRIFVDGSLETTLSPAFSGNFVTESRLQMGVFTINAAPGYYLDGVLDEVAIYGKALSQADIDSYYPVVQTPGDQTSAEGQDVTLPISVFDPNSTSFTFAAENLPAGLSINPTSGVISGTVGNDASEGSPYTVTVSATGQGGSTNEVSFNWTVTFVTPPEVANPGSQVTPPGENVSLQIVATDPEGRDITYSATGLPDGLAINAGTGLITGTPTTEGLFPVTVTVTNTDNKSTVIEFNWTIGMLQIYLPLAVK